MTTSRAPIPLAGVLGLASLLGAGCSTLAPRVEPPKQTALMKQSGTLLSTVEVRQRVDAMVPPILAFIEQAADRIRAGASDPEVRRRALLLKIDAIPVVYRAAYQPDPYAGVLDLWLLTYQIEDCIEAAEGPCDFGDQQPVALESARELREAYESVLFRVAPDRDGVERARERIRALARDYPLTGEGAIARRYTMTDEVASVVGSRGSDAFSVIGDVSMTLTELSSRLNTYLGGAGDLGRWQAELLLEDTLEQLEVVDTLAEARQAAGDVGRLSRSLEGIEDTLGPEGVEAILDRTLALVSEERRVVLDDVERQRELTLRFLSAERGLVLEAIEAERRAVLDQVHQERVATLAELDGLGERYLEATTARAIRVVDHLVWRVAQLGLVLMLVAALLTWLVLKAGGLRLAPGHGEKETTR